MIKFDVCKSGCYCNLKTIFCHFLILVSFRVNPPSALQWTVFVGCKVMLCYTATCDSLLCYAVDFSGKLNCCFL